MRAPSAVFASDEADDAEEQVEEVVQDRHLEDAEQLRAARVAGEAHVAVVGRDAGNEARGSRRARTRRRPRRQRRWLGALPSTGCCVPVIARGSLSGPKNTDLDDRTTRPSRSAGAPPGRPADSAAMGESEADRSPELDQVRRMLFPQLPPDGGLGPDRCGDQRGGRSTASGGDRAPRVGRSERRSARRSSACCARNRRTGRRPTFRTISESKSEGVVSRDPSLPRAAASRQRRCGLPAVVWEPHGAPEQRRERPRA